MAARRAIPSRSIDRTVIPASPFPLLDDPLQQRGHPDASVVSEVEELGAELRLELGVENRCPAGCALAPAVVLRDRRLLQRLALAGGIALPRFARSIAD